jgi:hypothetical protein
MQGTYIKTYFMFDNCFPPDNRAVYKKYGSDRDAIDDNIIRPGKDAICMPNI